MRGRSCCAESIPDPASVSIPAPIAALLIPHLHAAHFMRLQDGPLPDEPRRRPYTVKSDFVIFIFRCRFQSDRYGPFFESQASAGISRIITCISIRLCARSVRAVVQRICSAQGPKNCQRVIWERISPARAKFPRARSNFGWDTSNKPICTRPHLITAPLVGSKGHPPDSSARLVISSNRSFSLYQLINRYFLWLMTGIDTRVV